MKPVRYSITLPKAKVGGATSFCVSSLLIEFSGVTLKAIVHIGTEKTGTTSIQSFLYQNRGKLQEKGFHFLQCAGETNNRALPSYCLNDDHQDDFFRNLGITTLEARLAYKRQFIADLENELAGLPSHIGAVIISSEHFHSRIQTEAEMDNVHRLLSTYFSEIEIVCYLRDQPSTCISYYSTVLKSGSTSSFAEFIRHCRPNNTYFNYWRMLQNWERCFGFDALNVSLFSSEHFLNGSLLDDFTAKIDPQLVGALDLSVQNENESLNPSGQALLRAINLAFPLRTLRPELQTLQEQCQRYISQQFRGKGRQLSAESQGEICAAFAMGNESLRLRYFPDEPTILEPPAAPDNPESIAVKEFVNGFEELLRIIAVEGAQVLREGEHVGACNILFSNINELLHKHGETKMLKTLSGEEIGLLRDLALSVEGLKVPAAIMTLEMIESAVSSQ